MGIDKVDLVDNDKDDGSANHTMSDEYILPNRKLFYILWIHLYSFSIILSVLIALNDDSDQSKSEETTVTTLMNMRDSSGIMSLIEPGKCDCCGENSDSAHLVSKADGNCWWCRFLLIFQNFS